MTGALGACCGGVVGRVTISDQTVNNGVVGDVAVATASFGTDRTLKNHNLTVLQTWLSAGSTGGYEIRATKLSGTNPSGAAVGSWLNLGTTRSWSVSDTLTDGSPVSCVLQIEIGYAGANTALDTANITITASSIEP